MFRMSMGNGWYSAGSSDYAEGAQLHHKFSHCSQGENRKEGEHCRKWKRSALGYISILLYTFLVSSKWLEVYVRWKFLFSPAARAERLQSNVQRDKTDAVFSTYRSLLSHQTLTFTAMSSAACLFRRAWDDLLQKLLQSCLELGRLVALMRESH